MIWALIAYLCGSVPFAVVLGKLRGVDVRKMGSGNVGATNLGRALGKHWGVLCFLLDALKGLVPVVGSGAALKVIGQWDLSAIQTWQWLAVAVAAVLGHVFPIWLGFRGGKGVATGLGVLLGFWPILTVPALIAAATWLLVIAMSRYSSLASMSGALSLPLTVLALTAVRGDGLPGRVPLLVVTTVLALLVVVRHRPNIARLRAGTEPKVGRGGSSEQ